MRLSTERDRDAARRHRGPACRARRRRYASSTPRTPTAGTPRRPATTSGSSRRALDTWTGIASRIVVATKGGLTRPQGNWIADGRARHLAAACEASRRRSASSASISISCTRPIRERRSSTSVRALAALQARRTGRARSACATSTSGRSRRPARITEIAFGADRAQRLARRGLLSGVVDVLPRATASALIAHRPLGGARRRTRTQSDPRARRPRRAPRRDRRSRLRWPG